MGDRRPGRPQAAGAPGPVLQNYWEAFTFSISVDVE